MTERDVSDYVDNKPQRNAAISHDGLACACVEQQFAPSLLRTDLEGELLPHDAG